MVMPAAKVGVHRGLLVTRTGYYLPFDSPTKGKKDSNAVPSPCSDLGNPSGPPSVVLFAEG